MIYLPHTAMWCEPGCITINQCCYRCLNFISLNPTHRPKMLNSLSPEMVSAWRGETNLPACSLTRWLCLAASTNENQLSCTPNNGVITYWLCGHTTVSERAVCVQYMLPCEVVEMQKRLACVAYSLHCTNLHHTFRGVSDE